MAMRGELSPSIAKKKQLNVAEVARREYIEALRAFHDLKVDPKEEEESQEADEMVTARLRDFMKPTYWAAIN